jgi:phospholipid/cholesterol/gamma-HCH transport system permease protein
VDQRLKGPAVVLDTIGTVTLRALTEIGAVGLLGVRVATLAVRPPYRFGNLLASCEAIGVGSMFVVMLTGFFTGAVFGMQSAAAFALFDASSLVGATVALSLTRELAPVLTGLMVSGRAGSAIATELGSMRVTEQIDALATMAVDPEHYLLVPRVAAGILTAPILCMLFNSVGLLGSYLVAVKLSGISEAAFWTRISDWLDGADVAGGLIKAAIFGGLVTLISCYKGFHASGGAKGVGVATTEAVVMSSVLILVSDYFLSAAMIPWWSGGGP